MFRYCRPINGGALVYDSDRDAAGFDRGMGSRGVVVGGSGECPDRASTGLPKCDGTENDGVLRQWHHDDPRRRAIERRQARVGILEPAAGHVGGRTSELPCIFVKLQSDCRRGERFL